MTKTALSLSAAILAITAFAPAALAETTPAAVGQTTPVVEGAGATTTMALASLSTEAVAPVRQGGWKLTAINAQSGKRIAAAHPFYIDGTYSFAQVRNPEHFPGGLAEESAYTYRFSGLYHAAAAGVHSFTPAILGSISSSVSSPGTRPDGQPAAGEIGGVGVNVGVACRASLKVKEIDVIDFAARVRPTEGDQTASTGSLDLAAGDHPIEFQIFCPVNHAAAHNLAFRLAVQRPNGSAEENATVYFPKTTD
jgi:hypothetical protein